LLLLLLARLLLLAGLLLLTGLLLFRLAGAALALLELVVVLGVFLEADVPTLLGLELHAAIAFGLVAAALLLVHLAAAQASRLLVRAIRLAALRAALARLLLLLLAGILLAGILLAGVLLLLAGVLRLAGGLVLVGHGRLLSIRTVAGERLTLGRAVYPVR